MTRQSIRWAKSPKEFFIRKDGGVRARRDPKEFFSNIKQIERHEVVLSPKPGRRLLLLWALRPRGSIA